jgi:hypothetical protein
VQLPLDRPPQARYAQAHQGGLLCEGSNSKDDPGVALMTLDAVTWGPSWARSLVWVLALSAAAHAQTTTMREATPTEAQAFLRQQSKRVLTFVGYSGAGYQDEAAMLREAGRILDGFEPAKTIVNIGATPDGIGAVYELAKRRGFVTTGIVSTQARQHGVKLSPHVDHVFLITDETWGGLIKGTRELSPTSRAMVDSSDVIIGIGGGEVARDEMTAARRAGKEVRFVPADMNHQKAIETARKKGTPRPTNFRGAADPVFRPSISP